MHSDIDPRMSNRKILPGIPDDKVLVRRRVSGGNDGNLKSLAAGFTTSGHYLRISYFMHVQTRGVRTADMDIRRPESADTAKQTHLQTRTIRGSKATSIVCRTNLERKWQCTSSQQFENWSIFGHCSRLCKKACLTVWGPRHCLLDTRRRRCRVDVRAQAVASMPTSNIRSSF